MIFYFLFFKLITPKTKSTKKENDAMMHIATKAFCSSPNGYGLFAAPLAPNPM